SPGAGGETFLLLLEKYAPVGRALPEPDPELALGMCDELLGTAQHARDVRADAHVMPPAGAHLEHRIERRDLHHLHERQAQVLRHGLEQLRSEKALVLLLREAERREHRRALPAGGKLLDPVVDLLTRVLAQER